MKTVFSLIISAFFIASFNTSYSQEICKVLKPEIAGKYEGACKNGLANGKGIAEGSDKYEGRFKNGLPEGNGKYTWSTGEVYDGSWKAGLREGQGKLFYKVAGADSVKNGYWANDIYVRKIVPNPYTVLRKESVTRYNIRRTGDGDKIIFTIMQNGSTTFSFSNLLFIPNSGSTYRIGQSHGFENVVFPFHCKVTLNASNAMKSGEINVDFEIEIIEPGTWTIDLNL